jgi:hypothetical protein
MAILLSLHRVSVCGVAEDEWERSKRRLTILLVPIRRMAELVVGVIFESDRA